MDIVQAITLAFIQGFTEFLPVSSSDLSFEIMTSKLFLSIVWVIRSSNKFAIFFSSFLAAITTETKGKS